MPHSSASPKLIPRGFALALTTIVIGLVLAYAVIVLDSVLSARRAGKVFQSSLAAEQIAEAGLHKAIFCLNATSGTNCSGTYSISYTGESNISFGGGTFSTVVTGSGATRLVTSTATDPTGRVAQVKMEVTTVPPTDNTSFSYALQSGQGGAYMSNNSSINGTIYSNGDVVCQSNNAIITGDAYSTKTGGKVDSCKVGFHAHADRVLNAKVMGDAYYKTDPTDIAGSTVTGTKHPNSATPSFAALPAFSLDFWRDSAAAGGTISGNYNLSSTTVSLGPIKIDGNLTMDNNVTVNVNGPIWVKGNITSSNNVTFRLNSSFGTYGTVILADNVDNPLTSGKIDLSNNTGIFGSGDPKSHILFVSSNSSTSDSSPAMLISNNASGAVFMTLNGTMRLANNAGANSLAGYRLYLDQNAAVTYVESDFSGQFSNSPSSNWHQSSTTWRQVK